MCAIRVKKRSANFESNLNANAKISIIANNLDRILNVARESSNQIAPIDNGDLRKSATIRHTSQLSGYIEWSTPYALVRYYKNSKNPQTTEWAEKDFERHKNQYLKYINQGVIK